LAGARPPPAAGAPTLPPRFGPPGGGAPTPPFWGGPGGGGPGDDEG
jgi:hypothetical protein